MALSTTVKAGAQPPLVSLTVKICPFTKWQLVAVERSNGRTFFFEFNKEKSILVPHQCQCQDQTTERDLFPYYSTFCETLKNYVIFCGNSFTGKIEKYIFSNVTGGFEEVDCPDLIYNPGNCATSSVIAILNYNSNQDQFVIEKDAETKTIRKFHRKFGRLMTLDEVPVKMIPKIRTINLNEKDLPAFRIKYCPQLDTDVVQVSVSGESFAFFFDPQTSDFSHAFCPTCLHSATLREDDLTPLYSEYCQEAKSMLVYCFNSSNGKIEQYCYDGTTRGFYQVNHPELIYNPLMNIHEPRTLFVTLSENMTTVISKDINGRLKKEIACPALKSYQVIPIMNVKTLEEGAAISKRQNNMKGQKTETGEILEQTSIVKANENMFPKNTVPEKTCMKNRENDPIQSQNDSLFEINSVERIGETQKKAFGKLFSNNPHHEKMEKELTKRLEEEPTLRSLFSTRQVGGNASKTESSKTVFEKIPYQKAASNEKETEINGEQKMESVASWTKQFDDQMQRNKNIQLDESDPEPVVLIDLDESNGLEDVEDSDFSDFENDNEYVKTHPRVTSHFVGKCNFILLDAATSENDQHNLAEKDANPSGKDSSSDLQDAHEQQ